MPQFFGKLCFDLCESLSGSEDGNSGVCDECEEISIASNDEIGARMNRERKYSIIVGIAADRRFERRRVQNLGDSFDILQHCFGLDSSSTEYLGKLRPFKDLIEFGQERGRRDEQKRAVTQMRKQSVRDSAPEKT